MLFSSSPIRRRTFSCMRGDLTIRGTEYRPNGEKLPIAIVCHGFMANQQTVRQYTRLLAKIGYCAYCFDFCGGSVPPLGRSDGATTDMTVLTEVQDLEAVMHMDVFREITPYTGRVLIVHGTADGIVKPDYAKKAAEAYANAELHLIDGGAHGFNRRHDTEAIRYLTAFAAL